MGKVKPKFRRTLWMVFDKRGRFMAADFKRWEAIEMACFQDDEFDEIRCTTRRFKQAGYRIVPVDLREAARIVRLFESPQLTLVMP